MYNNRRPRNTRGRSFSRRKSVKPNYMPVIIILCLSVGCGYATAKYVVEPVVNYVPQLTAEKQQDKAGTSGNEAVKTKTDEAGTAAGGQNEKTDIVEGDAKVDDIGKVAGYAVQFGCYSSKSAAEKVMGELNITGLQVLEQNKMYKIVGQIYDTKNKAKTELGKLPDTVNAFVTTIYK